MEANSTPQQRWRAKNKEKFYAKQREWRLNNREKHRALTRKYYLQAKAEGKPQEYYLKREYNLTKEQYDELLQLQGGVCAICSGPATDVDHDHDTNEVRGLLCHSCNRALAGVDNVEWLGKAFDYLLGEGSQEKLAAWRERRGIVVRS